MIRCRLGSVAEGSRGFSAFSTAPCIFAPRAGCTLDHSKARRGHTPAACTTEPTKATDLAIHNDPRNRQRQRQRPRKRRKLKNQNVENKKPMFHSVDVFHCPVVYHTRSQSQRTDHHFSTVSLANSVVILRRPSTCCVRRTPCTRGGFGQQGR